MWRIVLLVLIAIVFGRFTIGKPCVMTLTRQKYIRLVDVEGAEIVLLADGYEWMVVSESLKTGSRWKEAMRKMAKINTL